MKVESILKAKGRTVHTVGPDAEMTVARLAGEGGEIQARDLARIQDDKVVADALHLGEAHSLLTVSPLC